MPHDYARLEELARCYEQRHDDTVQPTRTERRQRKIEGCSDIARKRAERVCNEFDRTKLKLEFGIGGQAFAHELARQGLRITNGEKGPILVKMAGTFVAAANRAVGVRRGELSKFMETHTHDGNHFRLDAHADFGRAKHRDTVAPSISAGYAGRPGSYPQLLELLTHILDAQNK